jgi:hypothetical protein
MAIPYGVDSPIEKVECTNHVCRNFNKRLPELSKDRTCPLEMRKLLSKNLDRMRIGVYSAIKKRYNESMGAFFCNFLEVGDSSKRETSHSR